MSCSIGVTLVGLPNEVAELSVVVPDKRLAKEAVEALPAKSAESNLWGGDGFGEHAAQHCNSGKNSLKIRSEGTKVKWAESPSDDEDDMPQIRSVLPETRKALDGQVPVSIDSLEEATARKNEVVVEDDVQFIATPGAPSLYAGKLEGKCAEDAIDPPLAALGTALVSALAKRGHHRSCAWPIEGKAASPPEQQDRERCSEWKIRLPKQCTGATEAGGAFAIDVFPRAGILSWRVMRTYNQFETLLRRLQQMDQIAHRDISSQFPCWFSSHEGRRSKLEAWLRSVIAACPHAPLWNAEVVRFLPHMRI
jgi:hypothetical protein